MPDALQVILAETGLALSPLRNINSPERAVEFFRQLGYDFSPGSFGGSLVSLAAQAGELVVAVRHVAEAPGEEALIAALVNLLARIGLAVETIRQLHDQLLAGGGAAIPHIEDFPRRLTDFLILDYLERQKRQIHDTLLLLGLIELESAPAVGQPMRRVNWERFGQVFTEPSRIADDVYHWNDNFDSEKFLTRLERLMRSSGMPGGLYPQADTTRTVLGNSSTGLSELRFPIFQRGFTSATYAQFGITFSPAEAQGARRKGLAFLPYLMGAAEFQFTVCDRGELVFQSTADIKGVGLIVRPPFEVEGILNLTAAFRAAIQIRERAARSQEIILIGSPGGTRLALQGPGITWFIQNPQGQLDLGFEAELQAIRLVVTGGEGDGFLQKILSGVHLEAEANMALGFSLLGGFTFRGGARFAIELPTHIDLGPLKIDGLRFELAPTLEQFQLRAGALFRLELGPLKAVVENIGLQASLQFRQGNLGPANLDIAFKPPNGVGLSIEAGVVRGGGYLFFDFEREEYAGALQLVLANFINLSAIGLITTRI
jgi:hypothetical protein